MLFLLMYCSTVKAVSLARCIGSEGESVDLILSVVGQLPVFLYNPGGLFGYKVGYIYGGVQILMFTSCVFQDWFSQHLRTPPGHCSVPLWVGLSVSVGDHPDGAGCWLTWRGSFHFLFLGIHGHSLLSLSSWIFSAATMWYHKKYVFCCGEVHVFITHRLQ